MQRLFLVGKENFVQILVDNKKVYRYHARPISEFNLYIKSLELVTKREAHIYRDLSKVQFDMPVNLLEEYTFFNVNISYPKYHNCGTDFIAYRLGDDPKLVYSAIDTASYYAADREFNRFVNLYIAAQGSPLDRRWGHQQHSYKTLFSRFREMPLFNYKDKILVFDIFNDKLVHLQQNYQKDTTVFFDLSSTTRHFVAMQDLKNEKIWLYQREKQGRDYLYELKDGLTKSTQGNFIDAFARNIRVKNNYCYYLDEDYKILRVALNSR
jgi:hypothetical protein